MVSPRVLAAVLALVLVAMASEVKAGRVVILDDALCLESAGPCAVIILPGTPAGPAWCELLDWEFRRLLTAGECAIPREVLEAPRETPRIRAIGPGVPGGIFYDIPGWPPGTYFPGELHHERPSRHPSRHQPGPFPQPREWRHGQ
jgi:hypothetical protein